MMSLCLLIAEVWLLKSWGLFLLFFFLTIITHYPEAVFPSREIFTIILKKKTNSPLGSICKSIQCLYGNHKKVWLVWKEQRKAKKVFSKISLVQNCEKRNPLQKDPWAWNNANIISSERPSLTAQDELAHHLPPPPQPVTVLKTLLCFLYSTWH